MPNPWQIECGGASLPLGDVDAGFVLSAAPDVGVPEWATDDTARPRGDGTMFGSDFLSGQTVTLSVDVVGRDEAEARSRLDALATVWRGDAIRTTPGAVAALTSGTGRTAFGRPRRFSAAQALAHQGLIQVVADFATSDSVWYGEEHSLSVGFAPATGGGLLAPLASPLTTTASSDRSQAFRVDGTLATWPVVEIRGPITNPSIQIGERIRWDFALSLAYDETLVVDTRPWARTVLRGGASVAGSLSRRSTRLSASALTPGAYELTLRGLSDSGTASAAVSWRAAYPTP